MTQRAPVLRCAPDLQEAVILRVIDRRSQAGDRTLSDRYRKAADAIYARFDDAESRSAAFEALHGRLFEELECARPIADALEHLGLRPHAVLVVRARSPAEEEADLSPDRRTIGLRLLPDRFGTPELDRVLYHELGHVLDMLDPAFAGGLAGAPPRPTARRLQRDRFGLLWDCVVDGRTARAGLAPLATREERGAALPRLFPGVSPETARIVVDRLWDGARPAYDDLLRFADNQAALAAWAGIPTTVETASASAAGDAPPPAAGGPCPLCGFPTFAWAGAIPEGVEARIASDFPGWSHALGACERCVEGYAVTAEVGGVP